MHSESNSSRLGGMSDEEAVTRVIAGDKNAFEFLVRKYSPVLFRHLFLLTRSHTLAEDLTQETFLRAFRFIGQYDPQRPFHTWLTRIATNLAINEWRKQSRRETGLVDGFRLQREPRTEDVEGRALGSPRQSLEETELARALELAVAKLPDRMRAVVRLRYGQEMACSEIGELLGMNISAVKTTLFRAREILRGRLGSRLKDFHNRWGVS